jgi:hypothetical protein
MSSFSMNRKEMLSQVKWTIRDNPQFVMKHKFTDEILIDLINDAHREINDITWTIHNSTRIVLSAGTTSYSLPNDCYAINRVLLNLDTILSEKTITALDNEADGWYKSSTNTPTYYYQSWDKTKISFYPCPDTSYVIDMDYTQIASDLTSDTSVPFNGIDKYKTYHNLIVWRVVAYCLSVDNSPNATIFWELWSNGVGRMANQIGVTPNYIPFMSGKR